MGTLFNPVDIASGVQSTPTLNNNFDNIQTALGRVLNVYGDSTYGTNAMQVDIDMNSNQLLNTGTPTLPTHVITKGYGDSVYGNPRDWAVLLDALVDGDDYSSKEYAIGVTVPAGSSKTWATASAASAGQSATSAALANAYKLVALDWARKVDGIVDSVGYSAKAWAIGGTGVTDTAGAGAAKEWAVNPEDDLVDGTDYSAFHWAQKAAAWAMASGTAMIFFQAAAPTGWTKVTTHNNKALRVVSGSGGGSGGTHGLSTPPSTAHTHTGDVHTHTLPIGGNNPGTAFGMDNTQVSGSFTANVNVGGVGGGGTFDALLSNSGGGGATSSNGPTAFAPLYIDVIVCTKD